MSKKKTIQCHDCSGEIKILDKYEDLEADDLKFCPLCGSENIEINESGERTE